MKFITEDVLRDVYRKEPFTSYRLEEGARLTPGAVQFLADRGMNMFADGTMMDMGNGTPITKQSPEKLSAKPLEGSKKKCAKTLQRLSAEFLFTGQALLESDVFLAQQILELEKQIDVLKHTAEENPIPEIDFKVNTGMREEDSPVVMKEYFPITAFHIQTEKGREVAYMHKLRSQVVEIADDISEKFGEGGFDQRAKCRLNQIINRLSEMICLALGGKECQK